MHVSVCSGGGISTVGAVVQLQHGPPTRPSILPTAYGVAAIDGYLSIVATCGRLMVQAMRIWLFPTDWSPST